MFDMMLPSSSLKLHLSKMNMFGIGNSGGYRTPVVKFHV